MDVVIAGGGVGGLEALLALHAMAGDSVRLTLVAPDPEFSYRPLAVAEPFALGHAHRVPLSRFAEETGAELVIDAVVEVDDAGRQVRLRDGRMLGFEALLLAPGGRAAAGLEGATTWWPGGDSEDYGGLLRDIDEGYTKRLAIVVPLGAVWPLPAYELALMTAGEARSMGQDDVRVIIVTPEPGPLSLFGEEASAAVTEELRAAGVELRAGVVARADRGGLLLQPGGERLDVQRVFAVPRVLGPGIEGVPTDEEGFIRAGDDARVGLRGRGDAEGAPLWWPQGKVAGEYLPQWLAKQGVAPPASHAAPEGGVSVRRTLSAMRGAEAQYLFDLARRLDSADPAIAALGRRMHDTRDR